MKRNNKIFIQSLSSGSGSTERKDRLIGTSKCLDECSSFRARRAAFKKFLTRSSDYLPPPADYRPQRAKSEGVIVTRRLSCRARNVPALDSMLQKKLTAIVPVSFRRQFSGEAACVNFKFAHVPGEEKRKEQLRLANHLWANMSFPYLLSHMRGYLTALERMRLCCVSKLWNDPLANLNVTYLELMQHPTLTDDHFSLFLQKHRSLRHINILGCCRISNRSLRRVCECVPKLKELNISYCLQITDDGVKHLENCKELKLLHTAACNKITDKGMDYLHARLPNLQRPFMPIPRLTRQPGAYGLKPRPFFSPPSSDEKARAAKIATTGAKAASPSSTSPANYGAYSTSAMSPLSSPMSPNAPHTPPKINSQLKTVNSSNCPDYFEYPQQQQQQEDRIEHLRPLPRPLPRLAPLMRVTNSIIKRGSESTSSSARLREAKCKSFDQVSEMGDGMTRCLDTDARKSIVSNSLSSNVKLSQKAARHPERNGEGGGTRSTVPYSGISFKMTEGGNDIVRANVTARNVCDGIFKKESLTRTTDSADANSSSPTSSHVTHDKNY